VAQPANNDIKTNSGRRAPLKGMVGIAGGRAPRSTKEAGAVKEPRYRASSESVSRTVDESTGAGPPPRDQLEQHPATVLKDEGPGAPRVVRYDLPGGPVVLKEWQPAGSVIFRWWVRSIMRREIQNYRLLQDTGAIPRYLGQYGPTAFLMEWVDGLQLRRRLPQELKDLAVDGLERSLGILHERKFVHLDLHQRLNTLVSKQGQVWLVDLGQGIDCSRGPVRRLLFPWLAAIDRRAIVKFRARYAPHTLPEADRERLVARYADSATTWKNFHRRLRRWLLGSANEGR